MMENGCMSKMIKCQAWPAGSEEDYELQLKRITSLQYNINLPYTYCKRVFTSFYVMEQYCNVETQTQDISVVRVAPIKYTNRTRRKESTAAPDEDLIQSNLQSKTRSHATPFRNP